MYCIRCGVKLAEGEKSCPLCRTSVYHPEISFEQGEALYPADRLPAVRPHSLLAAALLTGGCLLPLLIVLLCDLQLSGGVTWSGYVVGALLLGYVILVLPLWFRRPNPVIFVPCDFAAIAAYLLYIQLMTGGKWFYVFALPTLGGIGLIVTAVVVLMHYLSRGSFYIFGGALMALGVFMYPVELLSEAAFNVGRFVGWCFYPMIPLVLLGGGLIFLAICRPARETMERKFFF